MSSIRQHPILVAFVILVLGITALTASTYLANQEQAQAGNWGGGATLVVTAPAAIVPIIDEIESIGTTTANESVLLTAKVSDTVRAVNFTDGMLVEEGAILVELTNAEETAMLAEAKATAEEASRQFNRVQNLIRQKLASETQLDVERVRMQTAEARLEAIVARLDDRLIRAPFAGLLGFRNVSPGTLLTQATPVTTLDDISIIKLDFDIPETALARIKPGQEVVARSAAWDKQAFTGTVATIGSRVDPVTRTIPVRALIPNEARLLRPGMLLTVDLILQRDQALVIPEEAIIPIQDKQFVYTVSDSGTAEQVAVVVGRRRPGIVEILEGVREGQEVITQGVIKIRPGSKVTRRGQQQSGAQPPQNRS